MFLDFRRYRIISIGHIIGVDITRHGYLLALCVHPFRSPMNSRPFSFSKKLRSEIIPKTANLVQQLCSGHSVLAQAYLAHQKRVPDYQAIEGHWVVFGSPWCSRLLPFGADLFADK